MRGMGERYLRRRNKSNGKVACPLFRALDSSFIQSALTDFQTQLQGYLGLNMPHATLDNLIGEKKIEPQDFPYLQGTLPYKVITLGSVTGDVGDAVRHWITFGVTAEAFLGPDLTYTTSLPELLGQRVTISYAPATAADQQTISIYGDLYSTPSYLIKLKPQLRIGGDVKAEGNPIDVGVDQNFTMDFRTPSFGLDQPSDRVENYLTTGGLYAVGLVGDKLTSKFLPVLQQRAQELDSFIKTSENWQSDSGLGEQYFLTMMTYFLETDVQADVLASQLQMVYLKQPSVAMIDTVMSKVTVFDITKAITVSGLLIDVDRSMYLPASKNGDLNTAPKFMNLAGIASSNSEHAIIEQVYKVGAISAIKAIQLANAEGQKIFRITSDNYNAVIPLLQTDAFVKSDIENAIHAGKEVVVHERQLQLSEWSGTGYILVDPLTGAGAYMISGGFAGASTIEGQQKFFGNQRNATLLDLIACLLADPDFLYSIALMIFVILLFPGPSVLAMVLLIIVFIMILAFWLEKILECRDMITSPHGRNHTETYAIA
jgi:hypothetical protein